MKEILAALFALLFVFTLALPVLADDYYDDVYELIDPENAALYEKYLNQGLSINVYNWGEYISDGSDGSLDINTAFEELTGIKVHYSTFATNEEMYAKLKGGSVDYDIVIPSDYMIGLMIEEDMLLPLDYGNIPNAQNIMDDFVGLEYDPDGLYSVPYTWGLVGIFYNTTMVNGEVDSWEIFWDETYEKNMLMFSNPRDAFGIAQKLLGYSFNSENQAEWQEALEKLKEQKPLNQDYVMDEIFDKMAGGEAAIAPYYSGDAKIILEDNPDIAFVYPKEGTNLFVDAMCIPSSSQQKEAAELYINFMCEAEIAFATTDFIGYSTPNALAYELLDDEVKNDPLFYPPDDVLENTEVFKSLSTEMNQKISTMWTDLRNTSNTSDGGSIVLPIALGIVVILMVVVIMVKRKKKQIEEY